MSIKSNTGNAKLDAAIDRRRASALAKLEALRLILMSEPKNWGGAGDFAYIDQELGDMLQGYGSDPEGGLDPKAYG